MSYIYLAAPYSDKSVQIMEAREKAISETCAKLMLQGLIVYSPITHGHALVKYLPESYQVDEDFWMKQCMSLLDSAEALYILQLPGWDRSSGVAYEISYAQAKGIPITYL